MQTYSAFQRRKRTGPGQGKPEPVLLSKPKEGPERNYLLSGMLGFERGPLHIDNVE